MRATGFRLFDYLRGSVPKQFTVHTETASPAASRCGLVLAVKASDLIAPVFLIIIADAAAK
jgi:hypothetical protein